MLLTALAFLKSTAASAGSTQMSDPRWGVDREQDRGRRPADSGSREFRRAARVKKKAMLSLNNEHSST